MTVYETTNLMQIKLWCQANSYWPGCKPGEPDRIAIGGSPFLQNEELELLDWKDWYKGFNKRNLKFVYDPSKGWFDMQPRINKPD